MKRIRDKVRNFKPREQVSIEDWEDIKTRHNLAKKLLKEDNPLYILLTESLNKAETMILENRLKEVRESHTITDSLTKVFITPKKVQDDEIVGQIKFLRTLLLELESWVERRDDVEQREAEGRVVIERNDAKEK